jgi:hypothetical protein
MPEHDPRLSIMTTSGLVRPLCGLPAVYQTEHITGRGGTARYRDPDDQDNLMGSWQHWAGDIAQYRAG